MTKQPNEEKKSGEYINPSRFQVEGDIKDHKTGKMMFSHEYLYLTIISRDVNNSIKIIPKFKSSTNQPK